MNLRARAWERAAHARIRAVLRPAPRRWREYRRLRRRRSERRLVGSLGSSVFVVMLGTLVWGKTSLSGAWSPAMMVARMLVFTGLAFMRRGGLWGLLYRQDSQVLLAIYPLARPVFFRWRWRRWLIGSSWLAVLAWVSFAPDSWSAAGQAVLAGLALWLVTVAAGLVLAAWLPQLPGGRIGLALIVAGLAAYFFREQLAPLMGPLRDTLLYGTPAGWAHLLVRGPAWSGVWLIPVGVLGVSIRSSFRRLEQEFCHEPPRPRGPLRTGPSFRRTRSRPR